MPEPKLGELIPLKQLAAQLPGRGGSKNKHVATLYRWTNEGVQGQRLRYVQVGDMRCSTVAWVHEFFARLTAANHT